MSASSGRSFHSIASLRPISKHSFSAQAADDSHPRVVKTLRMYAVGVLSPRQSGTLLFICVPFFALARKTPHHKIGKCHAAVRPEAPLSEAEGRSRREHPEPAEGQASSCRSTGSRFSSAERQNP